MADESLEELLSESFSKKKDRDKSFADLYDLGYEKNDFSVNDNREIFDAQKVLDQSREENLLDEYESDAWNKLQNVQKSFGTDDEIQSASNFELDSKKVLNGQDGYPIDVSAVKLVNENGISEKKQNLNKYITSGQTAGEERPQRIVTTNNRPKGHPVNRPVTNIGTRNSHASNAKAKEKSYDESKKPKKQKQKAQKNGGKMSYGAKGVENDWKSKAYGEKKKKSKFKRFLLILILVILILFGIISGLIFRYAGMLNIVETGDRVETNASVIDESYVKNILIIGSDTRNDENGRSDSMILVSINRKTNQIVQTSFMRDILVSIPGYGNAKLNAAYANGGAELVMDTIEENFKVKVDNYIRIDFFSFIDIIDAMGGLELTVNDDEANAMTDPMNEVNKLKGRAIGTGKLTQGGTYTMDGIQALAYARIRYAGDGDFDRTQRQREVIEKIIEKFKDLSIFEMNSVLETILPELTTNMSKTEIYFLCLRLPFIMGYDMKQFRIPYGEQYDTWNYGTTNDGQSVLEIDFDRNNELFKKVVIDGEKAE